MFEPRLKAPEADNKNYFSKQNPYVRDGWGMPNCTPYAMGRFHEVYGIWLPCRHNAEDWVKEAKGFEISEKPVLGSVAVWKVGEIGNGKDGAGHVCFVEELKTNLDFTGSNSGYFDSQYADITQDPKYKKLFFYLQTFKASNNYAWTGSTGKKYELVGFILPKKKPIESKNIYKTTGSLHLRSDAGKGNKSLLVMPKGSEFVSNGAFKTVDGVKWQNGCYKGINGWASTKYLIKVE